MPPSHFAGPMHAVVLAAGPGTRLRPLTVDRAKGMVRVANRPLLAWTVALLRRHGMADITLDVGHQADSIIEHFGDGGHLGVRIAYSRTWPLLGTAGNVRAIRGLEAPTLVFYGDNLTNTNAAEMVRFHRQRQADATIAVVPTSRPTEAGVVRVEAGTGRVRDFCEKPSLEELGRFPAPYRAWAAIHIVEPHILDGFPLGEDLDWGRDVFPSLIAGGAKVFAYDHGEYYIDVGSLERLRQAEADALVGRIEVGREPQGRPGGGQSGGLPRVARDARLIGPAIVGQECVVSSGASVEVSVIGDSCRIEPRASVRHSSLWVGVRVEEGAVVEGAIVADGCRIGRGATIGNGAVLGTGCQLGDGARLPAGEHLQPGTVW